MMDSRRNYAEEAVAKRKHAFEVYDKDLNDAFVSSPGDVEDRFLEDEHDDDKMILQKLTVPELKEQQRITTKTKKRLGKLLRDFEEDFLKRNDRKVELNLNDHLPKEDEYREYYR